MPDDQRAQIYVDGQLAWDGLVVELELSGGGVWDSDARLVGKPSPSPFVNQPPLAPAPEEVP